MPRRKHPRKRKKMHAPEGSTRAKGDIVEEIVASMHDIANIKLDRNIFLETTDGSGREREIDVLLTSHVSGYPVRVAIECKNEDKPIGVGKIDEFIGKLRDVGIPLQHGVMVSSSRYTSGAAQRAKQEGIRSYVLKEINDLIPEAILSSFQSIIYLLLTLCRIQVINDVSGSKSAREILFFYNNEGVLCGSVADILFQKWQSGILPNILGSHQIDLELPIGWHQIVDGKETFVKSISVYFTITGHVVTFPGMTKHYVLHDEEEDQISRQYFTALFERKPGKYPVSQLNNEDDFNNLISKMSGLSITIGRFHLPRIRWGPLYWPPSEKAILQLQKEFINNVSRNEIFDFSNLSIIDIEGEDLSAVLDPIVEDYYDFVDLSQN